jgi:4-hydroxy-tetrahydrodipicolinate synthase
VSEILRGFYAIALTPFDEMGDLLWDDLEREFDWIARCGAHGVVWPVNNSEQRVLTPGERAKGFEIAVQAVGGRIPVVAGVADTSKAGAVALAEAAGVAGADAVIALPPWGAKLHSEALIEDYFRALADASGVLVFVQNLLPPIGSGLSSQLIVELS